MEKGDENDKGGKSEGNRTRQFSESFEEQAGKRQRTMSDGPNSAGDYPIPGVTGASPPQFVLMEEVMNAANGMTKMSLAHEIALDDNFKLEERKAPENSLEKMVSENMQRAFWEILSAQLKETPPNFTQALVLLDEIKQILNSLLMPRQVKLKQEISEVLDTELIKQQAEHGSLDFLKYAKYVISVMGKLCAPVRDENIKKLSTMTEVVEIFKGIMETLHLMKLDMVNFTISAIRPDIKAYGVQYERDQFRKLLNTHSTLAEDGLSNTKKWIRRSITDDNRNGSNLDILNNAYIELLDWNDYPLPETMVNDGNRFIQLRLEFQRLIVTGAVMLVTLSVARSTIGDVTEFKRQMKEHICLLLNDCKCEKDIGNKIPNVSAQVVKETNEFLEKHGYVKLTGETEKLLTGQIMDISKPDHHIRRIVRKRMYEFLKETISCQMPTRLQVPPALTSLQPELTNLSKRFLQIVSYNRAVFMEFYDDILSSR